MRSRTSKCWKWQPAWWIINHADTVY